MTTDAFRYKRPFSPDHETEEQLQQWDTPDLTAEFLPEDGRTNALNKPRYISQKTAEPVIEDEMAVKPLTASDMEQIRQAAYDEGFAEGKEDGFSKGYAEGREQGQQDGINQGLAEGKKSGLAEGQAETEQKLLVLTQLIDQLQQPLQQLDKQVEQSLLQLALAMAQAVIATEVKTNPDVILQALQQATDVLPMQAGNMVIKLHPDDLAVVEQHYSAEQIAERGWQLRAEPAMAQGGCVVETKQSTVDRTLRQRIESSLEHFLHLQRQNPATQDS